jgi:hypothetical protein
MKAEMFAMRHSLNQKCTIKNYLFNIQIKKNKEEDESWNWMGKTTNLKR